MLCCWDDYGSRRARPDVNIAVASSSSTRRLSVYFTAVLSPAISNTRRLYTSLYFKRFVITLIKQRQGATQRKYKYKHTTQSDERELLTYRVGNKPLHDLDLLASVLPDSSGFAELLILINWTVSLLWAGEVLHDLFHRECTEWIWTTDYSGLFLTDSIKQQRALQGSDFRGSSPVPCGESWVFIFL